MVKRCDNCINYKKYDTCTSFCTHENHKGMLVPDFTSCPDHTPKKVGPFDNVKFYLKDSSTGEMELKYICEDCGKVMDIPFHWWLCLPIGTKEKHAQTPGYHFRCEECEKRREVK